MHDDGRLVDRRQTVLHAIGERRACSLAQPAKILDRAVPSCERDQRHRLAPGRPHAREDLAGAAALRRVDRRAGEHERADAIGLPHCELGDDLAAHRIGHERRPLKPDLVEPAAQRIGVLGDPVRDRRPLAAAMSRQVGNVGGEAFREHLCQGQQVPTRDAESVHQYHRRPRSSDARVHPDPVDTIPAGLQPA